MKEFHLEILTPSSPFFDGDCVSLVVPTYDGMMGILAGRSPLTAAIHDGRVVFTTPDGDVRVCAVTRGMVSVSSERVRILCESAAAPEDIDEENELRALEDAQIELRKRQSYEDYMLSQLAFAKAINRLKVKQYAAMHTNM